MEYGWMWLPGFQWIIQDICGFTLTRRRKSQVLQEETICKSELHCSRSLSKLKESFSKSCAKTPLFNGKQGEQHDKVKITKLQYSSYEKRRLHPGKSICPWKNGAWKTTFLLKWPPTLRLTVTWSRHLGVLIQEIHLSSVPAFLARTLQYQYHHIGHIPIQFSLPGSCSGRFWLHPPLLVTNVASTCTETMLSSGSLPTCAGLGSGSRASCLCFISLLNMFALIHQ